MIRQDDFNAALLDPARAVPEGIVNPGGTPATKRFDVYRNNVAVGLTEALETAFPVIAKLVGDEFFRAMAGVYLRAHPPRNPLMMFYGQDMPGFLAGFPPAASLLPYLPDIARLELALRHAYHAADAAPLDPSALAEVPEDALPDLRLAFAPAVQVIASPHPVHGIWAANALDGTKPVARPEGALVTRPAFDPVVDPLTPDEAATVAALLGGVPLGAALRPGVDFGALLTLLLRRNALVALTPKD